MNWNIWLRLLGIALASIAACDGSSATTQQQSGSSVACSASVGPLTAGATTDAGDVQVCGPGGVCTNLQGYPTSFPTFQTDAGQGWGCVYHTGKCGGPGCPDGG